MSAKGYQDRQAVRNGYVQIVIRFPMPIFNALVQDAYDKHVSVAEIVRRYVDASLDRG